MSGPSTRDICWWTVTFAYTGLAIYKHEVWPAAVGAFLLAVWTLVLVLEYLLRDSEHPDT